MIAARGRGGSTKKKRTEAVNFGGSCAAIELQSTVFAIWFEEGVASSPRTGTGVPVPRIMCKAEGLCCSLLFFDLSAAKFESTCAAMEL